LIGFFVANIVLEEYSNVCFILLFSSDFEPALFRTGLLLKASSVNLGAVVMIVAEVAPAYIIEPYSSAERIIELCIRCNVLLSAPYLRLFSIFMTFNLVLVSFFTLVICVLHVSQRLSLTYFYIEYSRNVCVLNFKRWVVGDVFL